MVSRRTFLKTGIAGVCVLAAARALDREAFASAGTSGPARAANWELHRIARRHAECVAAIAPVVLKGALPEGEATRQIAVREVVESFDRTVAGLSPAIQREIEELFGLLTFAPTRRLVAGVASPWNEAGEDEIAAFLARWRESRFALLQQGYQALARLTLACWYGNPRAWPRVGYDGAPYAKELGLA